MRSRKALQVHEWAGPARCALRVNVTSQHWAPYEEEETISGKVFRTLGDSGFYDLKKNGNLCWSLRPFPAANPAKPSKGQRTTQSTSLRVRGQQDETTSARFTLRCSYPSDCVLSSRTLNLCLPTAFTFTISMPKSCSSR